MISDVMTDATEKMAKAVDVAKDDFGTVRTGRINAALFQKIPVEYYGSPTPSRSSRPCRRRKPAR